MPHYFMKYESERASENSLLKFEREESDEIDEPDKPDDNIDF